MKSTSSTVEQHLAQFAMEAHGGLMRWNRFNTVSAHLIQGGVFWGAKGKPSVLGDVTVKVDLRNERVSHWPFGSPDRRSRWTYMNTPFLLARPDIQSEEIEPWQERGETWRRLKVRFPTDIATHSTEQTLYFDQQGLLKRHDYHVEISGDIGAAHYVSDIKEVSGIILPTKHRIFGLQPDGHAAPEPLVVSIDMDEIVLF